MSYWSEGLDLDVLVGKTVKSISIGPDEEELIIETLYTTYVFTTYGDCCSTTWFSEFLGIDTLLNQEIIKAEEVDLPNYNLDDGRSRQEYDQVYGYRFTTLRGYADLIFRNSSNGYYGGSCTISEGVVDKSFTPILTDWSA